MEEYEPYQIRSLLKKKGKRDISVEVEGIPRGITKAKGSMNEVIMGYLQEQTHIIKLSLQPHLGSGLDELLSILSAASESGLPVTIKGDYTPKDKQLYAKYITFRSFEMKVKDYRD